MPIGRGPVQSAIGQPAWVARGINGTEPVPMAVRPMTVARVRGLAAFTVLVALSALGACGEAAPTERAVERAAPITTTAVHNVDTTPTEGSVERAAPVTAAVRNVDARPSPAALRSFRDAAAAAPYWYTVDWQPPTTIEEIARGFSSVAIGIVHAAMIEPPRPDALQPYEGAPKLYHLDVTLDIDTAPSPAASTGAARLQVRVPVLASGMDGLGTAQPAAEHIKNAAPIGAWGVFLVDTKSGFAQSVAFESADGPLIGYFRSMDATVASFTTASLADALERSLAIRAPNCRDALPDHLDVPAQISSRSRRVGASPGRDHLDLRSCRR
jgi:hypothetical protein